MNSRFKVLRFVLRPIGLSFVNLCAVLHAQALDLQEYLPYVARSRSILASETDLTLTFEGSSETDFSWRFSGAEEDLQDNLRVDEGGLQLLTELSLTPSGGLIATQSYTPAWMIAPILVEGGIPYESASTHEGTEPGEHPWAGSTAATFTVEADLETIVTPLGSYEAAKLTLINHWQETSEEYTASGVVTQVWWVSKVIGVVKVRYAFEERYVEEEGIEEAEGVFDFELTESTLPDPVDPEVVDIPDPALKAALLAALGRENGPISAAEMEGLTELSANNLGIADLTGLNFAVNLTTLDLGRNQIVDLATLAELTKLRSLTLFANAIEDLSPLSGLVQLDTLLLRSNRIQDIRPLQALTTLSVIWLGWNEIQDISPLAALTNLIALELDHNDVQDLTPLSPLIKLTTVTVSNNEIEDVTPLAALTGLTVLRMHENDVRDLAPLASLMNLRTATVQQNFLDLAAGAGSRKVIDDWVVGGANVTFASQKVRPSSPEIVQISISLQGEGIVLEWPTAIGESYQIQTSNDLLQWMNGEGTAIPGTGETVERALSMNQESLTAFRLRITR